MQRKATEVMMAEGFGKEMGREKRFGFSQLENGEQQGSSEAGMGEL